MESILLIVMALADCGDGWYTGFAAQHIVTYLRFLYFILIMSLVKPTVSLHSDSNTFM
jgi:hypothetical protein